MRFLLLRSYFCERGKTLSSKPREDNESLTCVPFHRQRDNLSRHPDILKMAPGVKDRSWQASPLSPKQDEPYQIACKIFTKRIWWEVYFLYVTCWLISGMSLEVNGFSNGSCCLFYHNTNSRYLPTRSNIKHRKHVSEFWRMMRLWAFSWRREKSKFLSEVYHASLLDTEGGGQTPCQGRFTYWLYRGSPTISKWCASLKRR